MQLLSKKMQCRTMCNVARKNIPTLNNNFGVEHCDRSSSKAEHFFQLSRSSGFPFDEWNECFTWSDQMSFVTEATKNETKQKIRYRRSFDSLADDIVHSEWTWLSQMKFWVVYYSTLRHPPSMGWAGFAAIYRMKSAEKKPSLKLSWSRERWKLISMTDECARPFNSYLVSSFMRKIRRVGDVASSLILSFKCRLSVVARDGMFSRKMCKTFKKRVVERVLECESTEMEKGKKAFPMEIRSISR